MSDSTAPIANSSSPAPTAAAEHPITEAIQATPQELGHKVFVGNLPFDATSESIKELFAKVGNVTDAQIIHRGTRSLGYGFVTYTSEDDAVKAVSQLDKTEISGRQVNVEVAKPAPTAGSAAARAPRRAAKKAAEFSATAETAQEGVAGEEGEGAAPTRKARKPRKPRGPRAARADDETEEAGDAPTGNAVSDAADQLANTHLNEDGTPAAAGSTRTRKPRVRKPRKGKAAAGASLLEGEEGAPPALAPAVDGAAPKSRAPRRRGPPAGAESKTLLFVGNLSFDVDDAALGAAFTGCKVKTSVVVRRKFGQSAGRSKGFGFVDFESEEDQKKALGEFQGKDVLGRPLSLKVAIEGAETQEESNGAVQNESDEKVKADKAQAAAAQAEAEASIIAS